MPTPDEAPDPDGVVGQFESALGARLMYPTRVAVADDGTRFFSDSKANQVLGYQGTKLVTLLTGLDKPLGIAVHGNLLYVGNAGRGSVEVYDLTAKTYVRSLDGDFMMPNAIAVARDGVVYVADSSAHAVKVFTADGAAKTSFGELGAGDGQLRFPAAIAIDGDKVVVGDQGNHRLAIFDREGKWLDAIGEAIADSAANPADYAGRFTRIQGLAINDGKIYVLDSYHSHIQVLDWDGKSLGFIGRQGTCPTCIQLGLDVAFDADGSLIVSDPDARRWVTLSSRAEVGQ
jgi:DNA-binding beta-propeller fold protein YncE